MSSFVSYLISSEHQRRVRVALWILCFTILLAFGFMLILRDLREGMGAEVARAMDSVTKARTASTQTLEVMKHELTADICSDAYITELRRIAFLPDGINEVFYFDNGRILCSANVGRLAVPQMLASADIPATETMPALWIDRDLGRLGLPGMRGIFAVQGHFGVVLPMSKPARISSNALDMQVVIHASDGRFWPVAGTPGLYEQAIGQKTGFVGLIEAGLTSVQCDLGGLNCIAARAAPEVVMARGAPMLALATAISAILAAWLSGKGRQVLAHRWSFEQRFLRQIKAGQGLECAYQPLYGLADERILGCEVLARWRDIDGAMVFPDRFIPLVEKHGLTLSFTAKLVAQAHADLLVTLPQGRRLQVNFNIFPQDLSAALLLEIFAPFLMPDSPFDLVVEIVETAAIDLTTAQVEIEQLRRYGVRIYIDDFGSGYSSMHTLAGLSVDGVKLDRSFAMAPEGSVMANMLDHAIDLVQAAGRKVVVEGVEAVSCLEHLKATTKVDIAQGYHISRPLNPPAFAHFLAESDTPTAPVTRLVA